MTRSYVWHDSFICVTWLFHMFICVRSATWCMSMCDSSRSAAMLIDAHWLPHSYVWHDSFICVIWLVHMCDIPHEHAWHGSFICVTWLVQMCVMTHSHMWHDSFVDVCHDSFTYVTWLVRRCVSWLIHICDMTRAECYMTHANARQQLICIYPQKRQTIPQRRRIRVQSCYSTRTDCHIHMCDMTHVVPMCDMTYSYEWYDPFMCVPWLIHMFDMTHSYAWYDCGMTFCFEWVMSHIWMSHVTHMNESCHTWMSHVTHMSHKCVVWLFYLSDMTHSYVWHDSFISVVWRIHIRAGRFLRTLMF